MILVDNRIGSGELAQLLRSTNYLARLDYGDFAWWGEGEEGTVTIGVERKTLSDLLNSIMSGRLSGHQLIGLSDTFDFVYLLVEGKWKPDYKTGVLMAPRGKRWSPVAQGKRRFMARDVYNYLNTLAIMCNVQIIMTENKWVTCRWLDSCYSWWQKKWDNHRSHLQFTKPVKTAHLAKPSIVTKIASQLNGIGWDKAREIGKVYKSPRDLVKAEVGELVKVPGIGKTLAESIRRQLNAEI